MQKEVTSSDWLGQYQDLTRLAYTLPRLCPRVPVMALSLMNPRHPLPADAAELSAILGGNGSVPRLSTVARSWARCLLYALRESINILKLRRQVRPLLRRAREQSADVVMKTWGFGPDSLTKAADFYYGTLPPQLRQRGISCVLLCGDALSGESHSAFARTALSQTHMRYVPEKLLLPLWAPLVTACNQLLTGLRLRRLGRKARDRKFAAVCAHACLDCLSPSTAANSLYFYIAKAALKTWRARVFVTLYEGQSWEKPSWLGAKAANRDCVTVGYQHTIIMPYSFSLIGSNNGHWELPAAPDWVLCLGKATMAMMKPGHGPNGTRFVPFGSFRRKPGDSLPRPPRPGRHTVVVVPEGMLSEAELLFNFALRAASSVSDYHFIFRCHPMLPFDRVRPYLERDPEAFSNIEISEGPIEDDFARSSAVLYRGSSSVLYAVLHGLKPIYLHDDRAMDIDPLFQLRSWREYVSSPGEIIELLRGYASVTEERAAGEWKSAAEYVNGYTMPVEDASIDRFLAAVGLSNGKAVQ